jgi:serine/threonine protein phosphatase 1
MIYLISDIHGEYDLFIKLLEQINFNTKEDKLYIIGDVVDRGKDSIKALQYIYGNQDSMILLKGNHEDMMINAFKYYDNYHWFSNGGKVTFDEYMNLSKTEQNKILKYINELPCLLQIQVDNKKYILSHAGIQTDHNGNIIETQDQDFMLWSREEFLNDTEISNDVMVVVGHTPTVYLHKSALIWHSECGKKICIDCGAVFGYKLACLRLDDMKEFYVSK